jgi:microcystin-dependent protein
MADPFIGEIRAFSFTFSPIDWLPCDGAIYDIRMYQPLFAILGNMYGGDRTKNTFAVPNLMGNLTVGTGIGPGLSEWDVAEKKGTVEVALPYNGGAAHSHTMIGKHNTSSTAGTSGMSGKPGSNSVIDRLFYPPAQSELPYANLPTTMTLDPNVLTPQFGNALGVSNAHSNMQPYLPLLFCICHTGEWPSPPN